MKKQVILLAFLFIAFSAILNVSAFGVASLYASIEQGNPLVLKPGQTSNVYFTLQNMVSDEDVTAQVTLTNGSEIATLIDSSNQYLVKKGSADTKVNVRISIPSDASGKVYRVTLSVDTVTPGASGGVNLGLSIQKSFDVVVQAPPEEISEKSAAGVETWMLVIGAIIVIIILALLLKPRKKARRR